MNRRICLDLYQAITAISSKQRREALAKDRGLISLADDGAVIVSPVLDIRAQKILGLTASLRFQRLSTGHLKYLLWHRKYVFQR